MNLVTLLIILLLLGFFGGFHPGVVANWGHGPSGGIGLLLVIIIILAVTGKL